MPEILNERIRKNYLIVGGLCLFGIVYLFIDKQISILAFVLAVALAFTSHDIVRSYQRGRYAVYSGICTDIMEQRLKVGLFTVKVIRHFQMHLVNVDGDDEEEQVIYLKESKKIRILPDIQYEFVFRSGQPLDEISLLYLRKVPVMADSKRGGVDGNR